MRGVSSRRGQEMADEIVSVPEAMAAMTTAMDTTSLADSLPSIELPVPLHLSIRESTAVATLAQTDSDCANGRETPRRCGRRARRFLPELRLRSPAPMERRAPVARWPWSEGCDGDCGLPVTWATIWVQCHVRKWPTTTSGWILATTESTMD